MHHGLGFDRPVPHHGYVWWYLDALSDDGHHGLTIIAFIGSVFSPYYALSRRIGAGDPFRHVALNVALYGRPRRWAMTERHAVASRSPDHIEIGPSALHWDGTGLTIDIDEVTVPLPRRLRGRVRVHAPIVETTAHVLDSAGRHRWRPIAPCARVEVEMTSPGLRWSGPAYLDSNDGDAPLEQDFVRWTWSRTPLADGTVTLYDATRRDGTQASLALLYANAGGITPIEPPPVTPLPHTLWRVARDTRSEDGPARVVETLEDAPFYARSTLATRLLGQNATGMHESLDLNRFRSPIVQGMLPFRMPRWR